MKGGRTMRKIMRYVSVMTMCAMLMSVMAFPGVQATYGGTKFVGDLGTTSLEGHWKFDDGGSEQEPVDSSGNSHTG
jgi:hypothetical protein